MRMGTETIICIEHAGVSGFTIAEIGLSRGCGGLEGIALV